MVGWNYHQASLQRCRWPGRVAEMTMEIIFRWLESDYIKSTSCFRWTRTYQIAPSSSQLYSAEWVLFAKYSPYFLFLTSSAFTNSDHHWNRDSIWPSSLLDCFFCLYYSWMVYEWIKLGDFTPMTWYVPTTTVSVFLFFLFLPQIMNVLPIKLIRPSPYVSSSSTIGPYNVYLFYLPSSIVNNLGTVFTVSAYSTCFHSSRIHYEPALSAVPQFILYYKYPQLSYETFLSFYILHHFLYLLGGYMLAILLYIQHI